MNRNVRFVAWFPQVRALNDALGYDHLGIGTYVLLRVGMDDLKTVAGPHATPFESSPRIGVFGRNDDLGLRETIPFAPVDTATLDRWITLAVDSGGMR